MSTVNNVSVLSIQEQTCRHFGMTLTQLRGTCRDQRFATPRHIAMYLVREWTGLPFLAIGTQFSNRHYSTIMHGVEKIRSTKNDGDIEKAMTAITAALLNVSEYERRIQRLAKNNAVRQYIKQQWDPGVLEFKAAPTEVQDAVRRLVLQS